MGLLKYLLVIFAIAGGVYFASTKLKKAPDQVVAPAAPSCPGIQKAFTHLDSYMRGVVEPGSQVYAYEHWYQCNSPQRGDLILFKMGESPDPFVRIIRAIPGDRFKVVENKELKAWHLIVNDKVVMDNDKPYFFGGANPAALKNYEVQRNGVLGPGEVIVLSRNSPGDKDSGVFGIFSLQDLKGRVTTQSGISMVPDDGRPQSILEIKEAKGRVKYHTQVKSKRLPAAKSILKIKSKKKK